MNEPQYTVTCPIPLADYPHVLMSHGGGGRMMRRLLQDLILPALGGLSLERQSDAAVVEVEGARLAFTTDTFVVRPLFFPGGDIGSLAVHGTINDLAMVGARPLFLSVGLVLEEGFAMEELARILTSLRGAADAAGVTVVTGDTKVVERGRAEGLYLNTAGVGVVQHDLRIEPATIRPGDAILVSGDLGRHGIAIMSAREGLDFESAIESDSAPLAAAVLDLIANGVEVHCLRDLTRGGLTSALVELSEDCGLAMEIDEVAIPVRGEVKAACEVLGLDPFRSRTRGASSLLSRTRTSSARLNLCVATRPAWTRCGWVWCAERAAKSFSADGSVSLECSTCQAGNSCPGFVDRRSLLNAGVRVVGTCPVRRGSNVRLAYSYNPVVT